MPDASERIPDREDLPADRQDLPKAFRAHVLRERLFPNNSTVLVGVSGRSDSVALLRLLAGLSRELRLRLVVGHVQRADVPDASADAMFVHHLATTLTLPFAATTTESTAAADPVRSSASHGADGSQSDPWFTPLSNLAGKVGATVIATAETQDDAAERLLDVFLTDDPSFDGLLQTSVGMRMRPLLLFSHEACVTFLTRRGFLFRLNPDALTLDTPAAKIRLLVLPLLQRHSRADAPRNLTAASELLAAEDAFLNQLARAARDEVSWTSATERVAFDHARWERLPSSIRHRLLLDVVQSLHPTTTVSRTDLQQLDSRCRSLTDGAGFSFGALKVSCADGILTLHVSSSSFPS